LFLCFTGKGGEGVGWVYSVQSREKDYFYCAPVEGNYPQKAGEENSTAICDEVTTESRLAKAN
jgi:hypothetical protein